MKMVMLTGKVSYKQRMKKEEEETRKFGGIKVYLFIFFKIKLFTSLTSDISWVNLTESAMTNKLKHISLINCGKKRVSAMTKKMNAFLNFSHILYLNLSALSNG